MPDTRCPCCGAPPEEAQPDRLARCEYCGSLLSRPGWGSTPLTATCRVDAAGARQRLHRTLETRTKRAWQTRDPQLVRYPFRLVDDPRRPLEALAPLPPMIGARWRPSGSDLVRTSLSDDEAAQEGERRIPPIEEPAPGSSLVYYPFFRVVAAADDEESAAWIDGIDGQVMLADELLSRAARVGKARLLSGGLQAAAIAAVGALVLPFPFSLATLALAVGLQWRRPGE